LLTSQKQTHITDPCTIHTHWFNSESSGKLKIAYCSLIPKVIATRKKFLYDQTAFLCQPR